jgi:hypothetical protein
MKTYGVVVEGEYDKEALVEIIRKCLPSEIEIIVRPCGGKDRLMNKFPGFLESFRYEKQGLPVDKALVIRDAHNKDPDELSKKMENKIKGRNYPFPVKFVIIVQELEAWLLADGNAISKITQSRSGRTVTRVDENLESINNPKQRLQKILSVAQVPYTPQVARKIAQEIDLSKIKYRCPRFKGFHQAVIDC